MLHVVTVLIKQPDCAMQRQTREFGGFSRDCRALAAWLSELSVELVVIESTGIYWKSVHAHLENAGISARVINAHMIRHVLPDRKTDLADCQRLNRVLAGKTQSLALETPCDSVAAPA